MIIKTVNVNVPYVSSYESIISSFKKEEIIDFIDDQIEFWYNNYPKEPFSALALFGKHGSKIGQRFRWTLSGKKT